MTYVHLHSNLMFLYGLRLTFHVLQVLVHVRIIISRGSSLNHGPIRHVLPRGVMDCVGQDVDQLHLKQQLKSR